MPETPEIDPSLTSDPDLTVPCHDPYLLSIEDSNENNHQSNNDDSMNSKSSSSLDDSSISKSLSEMKKSVVCCDRVFDPFKQNT